MAAVYIFANLFTKSNSVDLNPVFNRLSSTGTHFFHENFIEKNQSKVLKDFQVLREFVTESEETALINELDPYLKKLKYEKDHWDDAIQGYRETEKRHWSPQNTQIIHRILSRGFPQCKTLSHIHILDLEASGCIKPHIDSIKFCGDTIAGLSLLTDCVMRLEKEKNVVDFLLPRRSLYIMKGFVRYEFTHAILDNKESKLGEKIVKKGRRISIVCRNEP